MWCRRTDELVDGPNAARVTPEALRRWDDRLEAIFQGKPYDMLDAALSDTVQRFPLDIQVPPHPLLLPHVSVLLCPTLQS